MIERFYVHNFRCLENFELPIAGKPSSLLIGKNGTGKSTVGLVLEILQKIARGTNRIGQLVKPSDFSRDRSDVPLRIEIEVKLGEIRFQYRLALELPEGFKELRIAEENLSCNGTNIYSRAKADVSLAKSDGNREANFRVDWHLVALPIIQEQSETDPLLVFKRWLGQMLIIAPIPSLMIGDSKSETLVPERSLSNFVDWLRGVLRHSPATYTEVEKYLRDIMPDFWDIKNLSTGANTTTLTVQFQQQKEAMLNIPFCDLSDGEKCYFVGAAVLASLKALGPHGFCFWDEPDNYLSLSEVGQFVMTIRRSFQSEGQLLITSHHPEAIRRFSGENTLFLHRRSHLEPTLVRPVSELHIDGDLVNALIRDDVEP
jgi:predicted ATPase